MPFDAKRQIIDLCDIAPLVDPSGKLYNTLISRNAGVDFGASKMLPYLLEHHYFDEFTAIACDCEGIATSLINELKAHNIPLPERFAITGFDDVILGSMVSPAMPTISGDFNSIAHTVFDNLIRTASGALQVSTRALTAVSICERQA